MKTPFPPRIYLTNDWSLHFDENPTKAWFVNHMSAVFGALTAVFMAASIDGITNLKYSGLGLSTVAVFLFSFSPLIWEYSTTAEVFALNNLLCSAVLYLSIKILHLVFISSLQDNSSISIHRLTMTGAFLSGLALTNQHTSLLHLSYFVLAVVFASVFYKLSGIWSLLLKSSFCFLFGLLPYSYIYFASFRSPEGSWGDTVTVRGFLRHVLRSEYGTFRLGGIEGSENWYERIIHYFQFVRKENKAALIFLVVIVGTALMVLSKRSFTVNKSSNVQARFASTSSQQGKNSSQKRRKEENSSQISTSVDSPAVAKGECERELISLKNRLFLIVFGGWIYYLLIWHCIFSNLPLSSPMPYNVHSRFWMQPNILLFLMYGVAIEEIKSVVSPFLPFLRNKIMETAIVAVFLSTLLYHRVPLNNRSELGWIIHKYGEATLSVMPDQSLLLSHTDIDLNSIRYLRLCENYPNSSSEHPESKKIQQFSTQMMPYPWFSYKQSAYFGNFSMPDVSFPEISTARTSVGNRMFINRLLRGNLEKLTSSDKSTKKAEKKKQKTKVKTGGERFPGGVYIDMQAINDIEIEDMNEWLKEFQLIPWGSQYRVVPSLVTPLTNSSFSTIEEFHILSYQQLKQFKSILFSFQSDLLQNSDPHSSSPPLVSQFHLLFPVGTWESVVMNIFNDIHNQFGLSLLTYVIYRQNLKNMTLETLPLLLDRLFVAIELLTFAHQNVEKYQTLSSSAKDLHKNTALSYLRLHGLLTVVEQFKDKLKVVVDYQRQHHEKVSHVLVFVLSLTSVFVLTACVYE
jgi:biotin transporter BioY